MDWTNAGLWLAVVASGLYHGLNPGMGWPLALSARLMGRGSRDLTMSLAPLAAGHAVAMLVILLPFALASALAGAQREIRVAGAGAVVAFGLFRLINRRHPRALRPDQADTARSLVVCHRNRAWRGADAAADLSWPLRR